MAGSTIVVRIVSDASKAKRELDELGDKTDAFGKKIAIVAKTAIAGLAVDKLVQFGKAAVQAASATYESMSKVKVVFGEASGAVVDFANTAAESFGISKRAALEATGTFGNLFTSMRIGVADSQEMSLTLVKLAADLGSFNNVSIDDVFTALRSGLVGEQEPLRRLGINLTEARLKAEAFRLGLGDGISTLDAAAKAQAAYSLIIQDSSNAQGDFGRTSDGLANQTKILQAEFDNLQAQIGEKLLPVVVEFTGALIDLTREAEKFFNFFESHGRDFEGFAGVFGDAGPSELTLALIKARGATTQFVPPIKQAVAAVEHLKAAVIGANDGARIFGLSMGQLTRATDAAGAAALRAANAYASFNLLQLRAQRDGVGQFTILHRDFVDKQVSDYLNAVADGIGSGGGGAIDNIGNAMEDLGNYLHALAQKQVDDLNDVYSSIGASISLDSAANAVDDAKQRLQSLVDEFNGLPGRIADAEGTVGSLLAAATAITPEEQQVIDQAQAEVDKITKALQGVTEEVNAPASSFAGPATVSQSSKAAFSLNDLKVAENKLEAAKRSAVGPTRELEQAEKDLADLRERYLEIPKQIEGAQRSLVSAEQALVEAKRRQIEAGKDLLDQGPDAIQQYKDLAAAAGLSADEVNRLVDGMIAAGNAAGLVDVFGNGYLFQPPDQADATRRFVAGLASFDTGGIVGGPKGAAQLVVAHGGETILPTHKGSVATMPPITINAGFGADAQAIANAVRKALLDVQRKNGSLGLN